MRVLVTGGAGFIGSHTIIHLLHAGHEVLVVDNFINSNPEVFNRLHQITGVEVPWRELDVCDEQAMMDLLATEKVDAAIHFAGLKAVGESVEQPLRYYENNLVSTFSLVKAMLAHNVTKLVFSSSATVYGPRNPSPYLEHMTTSSSSPYGWTKVMQEQILADVAAANPGFQVALLRYFNPVGAHESGLIGEDPQGIPNNLMPFITQVAVGRREKLSIFGDDYDTADGTAERDYIHIDDLARGHVAALDKLAEIDDSVNAWNLGTGKPTSVLEIVHAMESAIGRPLPYVMAPRRAGDLASFYGDPTKAREELGWEAHKTIDDICVDQWRWQSNNPNGYAD
ncbi:MAG: UDP-glucose 4-epimerase GalE [Propionibacteriaceae bacterium]